MSWQQFKDAILAVADKPETIPDTNTVAALYAKQYDLAIKRGADSVYNFSIVSGSVDSMQNLFKSALDKGITIDGPYDLVAEMGAGVQSYWAGVQMKLIPNLPNTVATTIPLTATATTAITQNKVFNTGKWIQALKSPVPPTNPKPAQTKVNPKPADDFKVRKMLDDAGYDAINKYEDNDGCVTLISGKTGEDVNDYKKAGCNGYNPGNDSKEAIIKSRILKNIGLDVWSKIPPVFRMQIYSFMYNADSSSDTDGGDKLRWISGLAQAVKNETAQYRVSLRSNKVLLAQATSYIKGLSTSDFETAYPQYLKVLDEQYQSISNTEYNSRIANNDIKWANYYKAAYPLTWKERPYKIETYYNESSENKDTQQPQRQQPKTNTNNVTSENVAVLDASTTGGATGPIPPTDNTGLIVDYFIRVATAHLNTIQGTIYTTSAYPPVGQILPGQITWTGYKLAPATASNVIKIPTKPKAGIDEAFDDAEVTKLQEAELAELRKLGIVDGEFESFDDEDKSNGNDTSDYVYTGTASKKQQQSIRSAVAAIRKPGTYYTKGSKVEVPKPPGKCGRYTFNIANNYVKGMNDNDMENGAINPAGGHANASGYRSNLKRIGYNEVVNVSGLTEGAIIAQLKKTTFNVGDVAIYWTDEAAVSAKDNSGLYGHTQIFTGGLQTGSGGKLWETDTPNNYGSYFVYNKWNHDKWHLIILTYPKTQ